MTVWSTTEARVLNVITQRSMSDFYLKSEVLNGNKEITWLYL